MRAKYNIALPKNSKSEIVGIDLFFVCLVFYFLLSFINISIPIFSVAFTNIKPPTARSSYIQNPSAFNIPILIYHYVEYVQDPKDTIRKSLNIEPAIFEAQVKTLKEANFTFLTPKDIVEISENRARIPEKPVILTFDDGYEDFYTDVYPILKKYNVRAVSYVITGFLDQPNYMTSDQLREIASSNLVEIACHTAHHPNLKSMSDIDAEREIRGCFEDLVSEFGITPVSFAYPYGEYREELFPLVKNSGFTNAVTTVDGMKVDKNYLFSIPRVRPGSRIGQELIAYLLREQYISLNSK